MATKKYNPKSFWSVFRRVQIALWSFVLFVVLFFIGVNYGLLGEMPDLDAIQPGYFDALTARTGLDLSQFGIYPG